MDRTRPLVDPRSLEPRDLRYPSLPRSACSARNLAAHGAEDRRKVIHARVALRREHAVQALTRNIRQFCELLESQGRIDEISENHRVQSTQ